MKFAPVWCLVALLTAGCALQPSIRVEDVMSAPGQDRGPARTGLLPTQADVAYGPHARNVLDFWRAEAKDPTPLVVFIHGGGFVNGGKEAATRVESRRVRQCLKNGVSFAAINYRFRTTTTLDEIMGDCARAIQFLRARAGEWNVDPTRIAAYGSSAGGGASLWLAVHDDLADPASADLVLRQSSRLLAAGHLNSQATYDCEQWSEYVGVSPKWLVRWSMGDDLEFYGVTSRDQVDSPAAKAVRAQVDMLSFLDESDAPLYVHNIKPDLPPRNRGEVIHHPRHALHLAKRARAAGLQVHLVTADVPARERIDVIEFFLEKFRGPPGESSLKRGDDSPAPVDR